MQTVCHGSERINNHRFHFLFMVLITDDKTSSRKRKKLPLDCALNVIGTVCWEGIKMCAWRRLTLTGRRGGELAVTQHTALTCEALFVHSNEAPRGSEAPSGCPPPPLPLRGALDADDTGGTGKEVSSSKMRLWLKCVSPHDRIGRWLNSVSGMKECLQTSSRSHTGNCVSLGGRFLRPQLAP